MSSSSDSDSSDSEFESDSYSEKEEEEEIISEEFCSVNEKLFGKFLPLSEIRIIGNVQVLSNYFYKTVSDITKKIVFHYGSIVDGVEINKERLFGNDGGRKKRVEFSPGEYISFFEAQFGTFFGHSVFGRIRLKTNLGRDIIAGKATNFKKTATYKYKGRINFVGGIVNRNRNSSYLSVLGLSVEPTPKQENEDLKERKKFILEEMEIYHLKKKFGVKIYGMKDIIFPFALFLL